MKKFINGRFNGVSTKYLNNYIVWHNFINWAKGSSEKKRDIFTTFVLSTLKKVRYCDLSSRAPIPTFGLISHILWNSRLFVQPFPENLIYWNYHEECARDKPCDRTATCRCKVLRLERWRYITSHMRSRRLSLRAGSLLSMEMSHCRRPGGYQDLIQFRQQSE